MKRFPSRPPSSIYVRHRPSVRLFCLCAVTLCSSHIVFVRSIKPERGVGGWGCSTLSLGPRVEVWGSISFLSFFFLGAFFFLSLGFLLLPWRS